jgi:heterodisulfide reductase subunit B
MKYLYYPGCSQKATGRSYEESLLAICPKLGIELVEVEDWNCCGTTTVISVNKVLSLSLSARNLALAEKQGGKGVTVLTPCPSCWLSLAKANKLLEQDSELSRKVRDALKSGGLTYEGTVNVRHLLEVIVNEVGAERLKKEVGAPLSGLKIAPYYGCQVLRPYAVGDNQEDPQNLETIIKALGAEVASFEMRAACCGGTLVATREDVGDTMSSDVLRSIVNAGADAIVTPCSLCQVTMESIQGKSQKLLGDTVNIPVLSIAQLIGLAMGLSDKQLALQRSLIPVSCLREARKQLPAA